MSSTAIEVCKLIDVLSMKEKKENLFFKKRVLQSPHGEERKPFLGSLIKRIVISSSINSLVSSIYAFNEKLLFLL